MKRKMLGKMLVIATNAHADQFDLGGRPYILHPLKVMHYLKTDDEELMCIALGHDIIEDTSVTAQDLITAGMSGRVVAGILLLSKRFGQSYEDYKTAVMSSRDAMLVKMADLRHNTDIRRLRGVSQKDSDRITKYHQFYKQIQERLETLDE